MAISIGAFMIYQKKFIVYLKPFKTEVSWFLGLALFSMVRSGIEHDYMYALKHVISVLSFVTVIPFILFVARRLRINSEKELIRSILIVSTVAGCISILCVFFPMLDSFVRNELIQYNEEDYLYANIRRGFGIASALTSQYGYIQGTIIAICPFFLKENKWFLFFIPFVLLSILVNARTGVLIAMWGVIVYVFISGKKMALPLAGLMLCLYFFLEELMTALHFNSETIEWIMDFNNQMADISTGDFSGGTASTLINSMNVWPSNAIEWLIGKGILMYHADLVGETRTDIGWLLQLSYGGLLYIFMLYYVFVIMAKRLVKFDLKIIMIVFAGIVFIVNTKSRIFPSTGEFTFLMLLYFICILDKRVVTILQPDKKK
jgi:ABC-type multidrug transport system fused ATPase/permease subunit